MRKASMLWAAVAATFTLNGGGAALADDIPIGNLVDFTGNTAVVGKVYGQAKVDAVKFINEHGGVNGNMIDADTVDYSYEVPRAISAY